MVLSWWQVWLLKIGWRFTKAAYGAGLGDKTLAAVRAIDGEDLAGPEKASRVISDVFDAVRLDVQEAPDELRAASVQTATWVANSLVNQAVGVLRAEQGAALTKPVGR